MLSLKDQDIFQGPFLRSPCLGWMDSVGMDGMDGMTVGLVVRVGLVFLMKKLSMFLPLFIFTRFVAFNVFPVSVRLL